MIPLYCDFELPASPLWEPGTYDTAHIPEKSFN